MRYGEWAPVVLEVARFDADKAERVFGWLMRNVFAAYLNRMRELATEAYHRDVLHYCLQAPYAEEGKLKKPELPELLRD